MKPFFPKPSLPSSTLLHSSRLPRSSSPRCLRFLLNTSDPHTLRSPSFVAIFANREVVLLRVSSCWFREQTRTSTLCRHRPALLQVVGVLVFWGASWCATHKAIKTEWELEMRYAKKKKLAEGAGHRIGYLALTFMLKYCYELGVKYVTIYAFSIDNFRRSPEEVQGVMDLMLEKVELLIREESLVNQYGVRLRFIGNLRLLSAPVRDAIERAMEATRNNNKAELSICIAYTSTDEIVHAVERSCEEKWNEMNSKTANGVGYGFGKLGVANNGDHSITLADVEKHMYTAATPDPDILIRTSGEARLSNFLLWQTSSCYLYSPSALWPEINFWYFLWAILNFQRNNHHLVKKRKQL